MVLLGFVKKPLKSGLYCYRINLFYDFPKMLRNPGSTFTKTTILQVVPVSQFFSAQDSVHDFVTLLQNGIVSYP